jgi:hypothetical protein
LTSSKLSLGEARIVNPVPKMEDQSYEIGLLHQTAKEKPKNMSLPVLAIIAGALATLGAGIDGLVSSPIASIVFLEKSDHGNISGSCCSSN